MRRIRVLSFVLAAVAGIGGFWVGSGGAAAETRPALALVPPSGRLGIGKTVLHLVDERRADPWVPSERRQLMVSLWYPAVPIGRTAPYVTNKESALLVRVFDPALPADLLSTVVTHGRRDAPVWPRPGGLPLVVVSPGWSMNAATQTVLAEDLASRGYVVAAIDHTYENYATEFPDGHLTECVACDVLAELPPDQAGDFFKRVTAQRPADVSFVLDRLTGPKPVWGGSRWIDRSRIGMAGHSIGGAGTVTSMVADPRIKAGADLDGGLTPVPATRFGRPFMALGEEHVETVHNAGLAQSWPLFTGWKRWFTVKGMAHESFSDYGILMGQLGVPMQNLEGTRAMRITTRYVAAFFDRNLNGKPQPLLDGPSAEFPEVAPARIPISGGAGAHRGCIAS